MEATRAMAQRNRTELPEWKAKFIDGMIEHGIIKFGDFTLKSGRSSPWFADLGNTGTGAKLWMVCSAFATEIHEHLRGKVEFDTVYGLPEKGVPIGPAVAAALEVLYKKSADWFITRKTGKTYGEATGASKDAAQKQMVIGTIPTAGARILLVDDVMTTGGAKYEEIEKLRKLFGNPEFAGLVVGLNRQEVTPDGKDAFAEFTERTGIPAAAIIDARDVMEYLAMEGDGRYARDLERMVKYLRVYGTREIKEWITSMGERLPGNRPMELTIKKANSIVIACDTKSIVEFVEIVRQTGLDPMVGAYKVGFMLALHHGLPTVKTIVKSNAPGKAVIYDHEKAGTDTTDTAKAFVEACKGTGMDAFIMFPQAGPETMRRLIYEALLADMKVIMGAWMTHPAYSVSEGGYLDDARLIEAYKTAALCGIREFVVPATKPDVMDMIKRALDEEGVKDPVYMSPGIGAQGGKVEDAARILGPRWHAIVGRAILQSGGKYGEAAKAIGDALMRK